MHTQEDEKKLKELTTEEKLKLVSVNSFAKRGTLICQYEYRYLTKNEYPHIDRGDTQLVLRNKRGLKIRNKNPNQKIKREHPSRSAMIELTDIIEEYNLPGFAKHTHKDCSVPIYHVHIFDEK